MKNKETTIRIKETSLNIRIDFNTENFNIEINGKDYKDYFNELTKESIDNAIKIKKGNIKVSVKGGGIENQARTLIKGILFLQYNNGLIEERVSLRNREKERETAGRTGKRKRSPSNKR